MILKSELRHGSYYKTEDNVIYKHSLPHKLEFRYAGTGIVNLFRIELTFTIFQFVEVELRQIFCKSTEFGSIVSIYKEPDELFYKLVIDGTRVKEFEYVHELQNLIYDIYDQELKSLDELFDGNRHLA